MYPKPKELLFALVFVPLDSKVYIFMSYVFENAALLKSFL